MKKLGKFEKSVKNEGKFSMGKFEKPIKMAGNF